MEDMEGVAEIMVEGATPLLRDRSSLVSRQKEREKIPPNVMSLKPTELLVHGLVLKKAKCYVLKSMN
jgi:hypothetical protein